MKIKSPSRALWILPLSLLWSSALAAHSGQATLVVPVQGIALDGDLDEWPAEAAWHPIALVAYGNRPKGAGDYQGRFRAGYNVEENALYVAVEVEDESVVIDAKTPWNWDTQDGCEVYLDLEHQDHGSPATQFSAYGDWTMDAHGQVSLRRQEGRHQYEWRIDVGGLSKGAVQLAPHMALGVDLAICDRDADGSFSWMTWGRGDHKVELLDRRGDALLLGEGTALGTMRLQVEGGGSPGKPRGMVRLRSLEKGWHIEASPDQRGACQVHLPVGRYGVAWQERGERADELEIEVEPGRVAQVPLVAMRPPLGRTAKAGPGRSIALRSDARRGEWLLYRVADGLPSASIRGLVQDQQGNVWFGAYQGGACRFDGQELRIFTEEDGLADNNVQSILEDSQGRMWFGTGWLSIEGKGVSRWDGEHFTTYTTADGLADNRVVSMLEDRSGNLWFGTWEGVSCFDGEQFTTYTTEDGLADNVVEGLLEDRQGNLWFGTGYGNSGGIAGGLNRWDGEQFTTYTIADGLPSNWVTSLLESRDGALWISTLGRGVSRWDGERFANFSQADGLAGNRVWAVAEDSEGYLFFATGGLSRYDGQEWTTLVPRDEEEINEVWAILADREGSVWLGYNGGGLRRYDGRHLRNFTTREGMPGNIVGNILEDRAGNLWLGSSEGLSRWDGERLVNFTEADGLARALIRSLLEDSQGHLWIATARGLSRYDGQGFLNFTAAHGLAHNLAETLLEDRKGHLWVGTREGLSRYDGRQWKTFTTADGLAHNRVVHLLEDRQGRLWVGTIGGLNWYDGTAFETVEGLVGERVQSILEDRAGRLWVGTTAGVSRYDGSQWKKFTQADGLAGEWTWPVLETPEGHIWFISPEGVTRYDGHSFATFTTRDGLVHNEVYAAFQDRQGMLWFGTAGGGVSRYDGQVFQSLTQRDGLAHDRVIGFLQDQSGHVWIATYGGATRYWPYRAPPGVAVTDVVADRRYGPVAQIEVPSSQDHLAIEFQGSSFKTRPEAMVYRYRLRDLEEDWRTTRATLAEYQDLPLGTYTFEVEAIDRDLDYSEEPARVRVRVHLPYERLAWMAALSVTALLLAWQAKRLVQRDRNLHQANEELRGEIAERQRVEIERERLDEQLRQLRYLYRLRAALGGVRSLEQVAQQAGQVVLEVLERAGGGGVLQECDGQAWSFGAGQTGPQHYQRPLVWGERERGRLHLWCGVALNEAQERALLDETAGQVGRALEALELTAQLLQSARLVSLGEMAAGVAHELNQPLSAIATVAGDLEWRLAEGRPLRPEQLKEMMRDITGLVERMAGTIGHLRVFSRDTGQEPGLPFSLNQAVRASLKVIGTQLSDHAIQVHLELEEELPAVVGQPYQLEQVFLNLLANARDALDEKGHADKRIWMRTRQEGGKVVLAEVEDNGMGIAPEHLERLFEPFFTTKGAEQGTGLGLSISYAIVHNHGGQIACQSQKGKGTTFRVTLPVAGEQGD